MKAAAEIGDMSTSKGMPEIASKTQRLGRDKEEFFSGAFRGARCYRHLEYFSWVKFLKISLASLNLP